MVHPLVEQLRFARSEFERGLSGVTEEAQTHLGWIARQAQEGSGSADAFDFFVCALAAAHRSANPLPPLYAELERSAVQTLAARDSTLHDARRRYRLRIEAAGLRDGSGQWHSALRELGAT